MLTVEVKVTPRASRDEVVGMRDGVLAVRVTAPPVDDAANRAVVKLIAKRAGVARSRVRIARGARGRNKRIEIEDADPELLERLISRG
ncbi:MAG TPA: DUF167 domain-containing protein [Solirubrobacterales bacterium]|nr:DUF167 domain-containing protein [Solirubrobacterales bacterium]